MLSLSLRFVGFVHVCVLVQMCVCMSMTSDRIKLGTLKVSSVGIGSLSWSKIGDRESIREMMAEAQRLGCNFVDTAERYGVSKRMEAMGGDYGGSEKLLSEFMPQRDSHHNPHLFHAHTSTSLNTKSIKLWKPASSLPFSTSSSASSSSSSLALKVATKFSPTPKRLDAQSVVNACEQSCQRLGVDSIDLYQIHTPDIYQPFRYWGFKNIKDEIYWDGLIECYKRGLVRNIGVSNYGQTLLMRAHEKFSKAKVPLVSNQINYSLLYRNQETNAQNTVDAAREMGIQTLGSMPLAMGLLTGKKAASRKRSILELNNFKTYEKDIQPLTRKMSEIAANRGKSMSQVALNYVISKGVIPLAGCNSKFQVQDNMGACAWRLSKMELAILEDLSDQVCSERSFLGAGLKRSNEKFVGYGFEKFDLH